MEVKQNFIHGAYTAAPSQKTFDNICPYTGEIICKVEIADKALVDRAVQSASESQKAWAAQSQQERSRILLKAAELLRKYNDELSEIEVKDNGKPLGEAVGGDVPSGADAVEYYAQVAVGIEGSYRREAGSFSYTKHAPLGVCAAIGACNYPTQIACWKSAPALAMGNAVVFKPSEHTPLGALRIAEIYLEAGLPPGIFNVVQGDGSTGALLSEHPGIDKIALTGSVATGKKIVSAASATLKHTSMELGGKSPIIVFADADEDQALAGVMLGNFYTQGEVCSNGTRVFVERPIYEKFLGRLKASAEKLVVGDPMKDSTHLGALISKEHRDKVLGYIQSGIDEGARLITGGKVPELSGKLHQGFFIEPTIFADCGDHMKIVREEIFGPVMSVLPFDEEEEVISRANNSSFGLASGVFTKDLTKAHRVADQMEAGVCWVNNYNLTPAGFPFGGMKESGFGRENCASTLLEYTQEKTVYVELESIDCHYPLA